ncbi:MAG: glycine dehydrogenase (aminomethyl-transferring), partial [Bacteroidota bacterium]
MSTIPFAGRHIGPDARETSEMLLAMGEPSLQTLVEKTIPSDIRIRKSLNIPAAISEAAYLEELRSISAGNQVFRSYIGLGYYDTITPGVILRNIFENPGWYTQYTPYQAEIAQGRLEALLNFQTMVSELTGLP